MALNLFLFDLKISIILSVLGILWHSAVEVTVSHCVLMVRASISLVALRYFQSA